MHNFINFLSTFYIPHGYEFDLKLDLDYFHLKVKQRDNLLSREKKVFGYADHYLLSKFAKRKKKRIHEKKT